MATQITEIMLIKTEFSARNLTCRISSPSPLIAVSELADSSVNFVVRPWVKGEDYWNVKFDLTRKIKESFDENDVEIPFPQRVVHMVSQES